MDEVQEFEAFVSEVEPRLRSALVASYGLDRGREATAAALGWAWEHRGGLTKLENKTAFLFRVGQSSTRRRKEPVIFARPEDTEPWVEPGLAPALAALTEHQRVAVVLVYGLSWTLREVAELTGTRVTTVQNHLERGLRNLRTSMEVTDHA
jgi:DNA-directed RNA polymerase specialized sigma24 family protein